MSHARALVRRMRMDDVIVIGAGYAGLLAANRLAPHARVRVIDPREVAVDRVRLHQLAAGTRALRRVARPLDGALDRRVARTLGRAAAVEPGLVRLEGGAALRARHVLLAHGRGAGRDGSIDALEGALELRERLASAAPGSAVAVIGAGLTGIELASEIAEAHPRLHVSLVARAAMGSDLAPGAAAHVRRVLAGLGVEIASAATGADIVIDQTGARPEPLGQASRFALDAAGRIRTDRLLRVLGTDGEPLEGVWGAGDAIAVDGLPWLRGGCASATPLGASAADRIRAASAAEPLEPVDVGFLFRCVSLGRREALIQFVDRDDRPTARWLRGSLAAAWKEAITAYAGIAPLRLSRVYTWPGAQRARRGAAVRS